MAGEATVYDPEIEMSYAAALAADQAGTLKKSVFTERGWYSPNIISPSSGGSYTSAEAIAAVAANLQDSDTIDFYQESGRIKARTLVNPTSISVADTSTINLSLTGDVLTADYIGSSSGITSRSAGTSLVLDSLFAQYGYYAVTGATTITVSGSTFGASAAMMVVANGTNIPSISGAIKWGSSGDYLNTSGVPNRLDVWHDGIDRRYAWSKEAAPTAIPVPAAPNIGAFTVNSVAVGGSVTWSTPTVTGYPTPTVTYQIKINGSVVQSNATSGTYTVPSGTSGQSLVVTATATNTSGTDTQDSNTVTIAAAAVAPTVGSFTLSAVNEGSQPTWTTPTVTGTPTPTVQYDLRLDGSLLQANVTSGSYTLGAGTATHTLTVRATATNTAGSDSEDSNAVTVGANPLSASAATFSSTTANFRTVSTEVYDNSTSGVFDAIGQVTGSLAGSGWIEIQYPNATDSGAIIAFDAASGLNSYGTNDFIMQLVPDGRLLYAENNTTTTASGFQFGSFDANTRARLRRNGSTITIESTTDGSTWTVRYTFPTTTSAALYVRVYLSSTRKCYQPRVAGVA